MLLSIILLVLWQSYIFLPIYATRVLSRSREITYTDLDERFSNVAEQHRIQSLQKAKAVQWLCFTPPTTLTNFEMVNAKLLLKALMHWYTHTSFILIS